MDGATDRRLVELGEFRRIRTVHYNTLQVDTVRALVGPGRGKPIGPASLAPAGTVGGADIQRRAGEPAGRAGRR